MSDKPQGTDDIKAILEQIVEHRKGERGTILERHAQTIMVGLVTVGIVFVSGSITNQNADIKVLQVQNDNLVGQMQDLKELVRLGRNNYVSRGEYIAHVQENERRLRSLEIKLSPRQQESQ